MLAYSIKRLGLAVLVALAVSALTFLLLRLSGDVAIALAGEGARTEDIENIRRIYGLDRPLIVQYVEWLLRMLRGDFGQSLYFKTDVVDSGPGQAADHGHPCVLSLLFALAVSIPLGVLAALFPNTWIDRLRLAVAVVGQALPNFFFALLLIMLFSISCAGCRSRAATPGRISSCRRLRSAITSRRRSCV